MALTVRATIVQTPAPDRLEVLDDHLVTVDDSGTIVSVEPTDATTVADVTLPDTSILLPGLVDTHLHAPQWPQLGTGLDLPLDRWLFEYTFPLEARYEDVDFARRVWDGMIPMLLRLGTTTAVYYGSLHEDATTALAEACVRHGQRAFVGRVAMDHPDGTPEWYRDADASSGVAASRRSIDAIAGLPGNRCVQPIITPRFVPACTDRLLEGLGELAAATGTRVQTHCSESDWEHEYVLDRHGCTDAMSLARFGLVRDHTVLAHGVHLTDDDRDLLVGLGAGVAHCPLSNAYFADAVFPTRRGLTAGMRIGLGSDVAGGPEPSLLAQCGHAVTSSRMLEAGVDPGDRDRGTPGTRIDVVTAFWMATLGGAELLGIPAGLLAPGRVFDAVAVEPPPSSGSDEDAARTLERTVRAGAGARVARVWVDGVDVTPA